MREPSDPCTVVGPIINHDQLEGLLGRIERGREEGARQIVGGAPQGLVLPPQVFVDATNEMTIAANELFGPVVSIIKVHGEDEALRVANDSNTVCRPPSSRATSSAATASRNASRLA
jgi:aldehyde dehydrogenase (NAD+)